MEAKDTAARYNIIEKQICQLKDEQIAIMEEIANYKVTFGKYKGKTLAEIAYKDYPYYRWLKDNELIPFTFNFKIDNHVITKIRSHYEYEAAAEYQMRKEEQGYVGRYII